MILNAVIHGTYHYGESPQQVEALINKVLYDLDPGTPWEAMAPGEDAYFSFATARHDADTFDWWPDNYLQIATNPRTGFGALTWTHTEERQVADSLYGHRWVSVNPRPAQDPAVIGDPGYPRWFHPSYTIPLDHVEAAIREFCHRGTGDRPECILWSSDGDDLDRLYVDAHQYRAVLRNAA